MKGLTEMGRELDLMRHYPQSKGRTGKRSAITEEDRAISRKFGEDYFDGDRKHGYGGFSYHPRFWTDTVKLFSEHYNLQDSSQILDIGCGKGFMIKDFSMLLPKATILGVDISDYAIGHAHSDIKESVSVANATNLPFADDQFDLVIAINTIHNLDRSECIKALQEIERVSKGNSFVMVDGWQNESERIALESWVLTAKTMMSKSDWVSLFKEANYSGDYWFWIVS